MKAMCLPHPAIIPKVKQRLSGFRPNLINNNKKLKKLITIDSNWISKSSKCVKGNRQKKIDNIYKIKKDKSNFIKVYSMPKEFIIDHLKMLGIFTLININTKVISKKVIIILKKLIDLTYLKVIIYLRVD